MLSPWPETFFPSNLLITLVEFLLFLGCSLLIPSRELEPEESQEEGDD
jgi:hypothetical protein